MQKAANTPPTRTANEPSRTFCVAVSSRTDEAQSTSHSVVKAAHHLGITNLHACQSLRLYFLCGSLSADDAQRLAQELLADPVADHFTLSDSNHIISPSTHNQHTIDVTLLPGVTDPAAENLIRAAHLLGLVGVQQAAAGQRYLLHGTLNQNELKRLAVEVCSNPVIQHHAIDQPIAPPFIPYQQADDTVEIIPLLEADDQELLALSAARRLSLNLAEMQAIQTYSRQEGRDPTDAELEMLAQTWSEHCVHKTFRAVIDYDGPLPGAPPDSPPVRQTIHGLLRTYIRAATEKVAKPWVYSAFVDNAGIIAFTDGWDVAFKVETHNHPSALEPFGGANTGVGGVVRDILGVSARPIANTDVLCFGPQDLSPEALPEGVLHPRRIADGVVRGIEDYGNKMGIPTVNGAILFHPGYTANPLVFCGCVGLLPHGSHRTGAQSGDLIVVIGGRTGRDGLRGATFSSMEMDHTTGEIAGSAVQIGHPIQEKQVQEVVLRARDQQLYHAITDCGAGGLSSAIGEMAHRLGGRVQLADVPLKYPGLRPWEIWLSEAQERMVLAVPPEQWPRLQAICAGQDVEAVCIGGFENTARLRLYYGAHLVGDLSTTFLHDGLPQRHMQAVWTPPTVKPQPLLDPPHNLTESLLALLVHPNIRSKEEVIRRYDHEVQGGVAVKPLVGVANAGPSDAVVLVPLDMSRQSNKGAALSVGICPLYGEHDPYAMAWAAVDEAMRNVVAVGADPDQVALLDNFCWGNTNLPDRLGSLVRCAQGCYDAAVAYGAPFISGKDSLNNEYADSSGQRHAIPGTLLISALGIVPDVNKTVTMDLKQPGNLLFLVGDTRDEMGGSHFGLLHGITDGVVPQPDLAALKKLRNLHQAIVAGLVQSCHDCSEGGIAVALAEMCLAGRLGAEVQVASLPGAERIERDDVLLFSESLCRVIVEVGPDDASAFEKAMAGVPYAQVGAVTVDARLHIIGKSAATLMSVPVTALENAWRGEAEYLSSSPNIPTQAQITPTPTRAHSSRVGSPRVLILHANGSNRDREAALACELAGAQPEIVHVNQLLHGERHLLDYHMLVVPGGFSYGDDLGAGTLWALDLCQRVGTDVERFIREGRPVLGICNGFQALVKAGLLPGSDWTYERTVTLTRNEQAQFECRWVYLQPNPNSPCLFTEGLNEPIYCPVAHGEGRVLALDGEALNALWQDNLAALTYVASDGTPAGYPGNPNGSALGIAGLCNPAGNVLGLMPHPEDHIFPWQHPRRSRGEIGMSGLRLFQNGVKYA